MSEVKERISISKFVEGYKKLNSDQLKDGYIKEHIKTTYAPILSKKLILEMMNEKSVIETPTKHIDLTVSHLNFIMAILALYTDIEPDKENKDGHVTPLTWDAYDALKANGIYEKLTNAIGKDLEELLLVQGQVMDTWHIKNTSSRSYINELVETASQKFGVAAGIGMQKIAEVIEDEAKLNKIMTALDKAIKKMK